MIEEPVYFIEPFNISIPKSIDWRETGAVTNVKDQGSCGSCYAFSATGALEGQHFRKTGQLIPLSEQNIVDCSSQYRNDGCDGGYPQQAFQYIKDNGGISTEDSYPYENDFYFDQNDTCKYKPENKDATVRGFVRIPEGDERKLLVALATIGPISVAIDASSRNFMHHHEGVYYNPNCRTEFTELDHAVLVVGYGTDTKHGDYFLIKNSWGTSWGEDGYVKMARNGKNHCGIATSPYYPLV